jgi:aminopeptidase N
MSSIGSRRTGRGRLAAVLATSALAAFWLSGSAAAAPPPPTPGAPDIGDPLFPGLGNGGYDVKSYTLDLDYQTTDAVQVIPATVTIKARATQSLSQFDLDFSGDSVSSVQVNGEPASYTWADEELVVVPAAPILDHRLFTVTVSYTSGPRAISPEDAGDLNKVLSIAWFATPSGSITAAQPSFAHRIYPSNDIPSDLATYTIRAVTPAGSTFVANGEKTQETTTGGRTTWVYHEREPMASELIQLAFGDLTVEKRAPVGGVRMRDVVPTSLVSTLEPALLRAPDHLNFMTNLVGPYPFKTYGSFISDATFPFALEDQTISLYPVAWFVPSPTVPIFGDPRFYESIMVHELAHQWFGDSVAPERWSDVWLNEGHATWYEWAWAVASGNARWYLGGTLEQRMHFTYTQGDIWRSLFGPVAMPSHGHDNVALMFSGNIYDGGALVLFALHEEVGDATFKAIERAWVERYRFRSASTEDFIALASEVAGRDLGPFLRDWLYGTKTPPMPGHPRWQVAPVGSAAASAGQAPAAADAFAMR